MKNSLRIKLLTAALSLTLSAGAWAGETLLASTELQLETGRAAAELWGDRLKNGYAENLLLLLKDADGRLLTAYTPTIRGGYNPLVSAVQIRPTAKKGADVANADNKAAAADVRKAPAEQLLLCVAQGDWQAASEYRVVDFHDTAKVQELFGAADSMGIVTDAHADSTGKAMLVRLTDGQENTAALPPGAEGRHLYFGGLHSLTAHDLDGDGQQELLGAQQLVLGSREVADVGAVWQLDAEDKWQHKGITIMTVTPTPKSNTVNDGMALTDQKGTVLPRKIVLPGGEATYPVFACTDVKLQNKINTVLAEECSEYLEAFYKGSADMAFKVINADTRLLSIQLISGKTSFIHHQVNIDPQTGSLLRLDQLLNTRDKDLLPLLRLLCTNRRLTLGERLPEEWYIEGKNLFLMQRVEGNDEVAGFDLANLHKFLLDKKWLNTD